MWGFTGIAGHRALSAGTLLIAGGGLVLYQMTSLVLGPAGSRQLHVSLTIPAVDADDRAESWTSSGNLALGTLAARASALPAGAPTGVKHRASTTPVVYHVPAPEPPVVSPVPTPHPHPSGPPVPPIAGPSDQQAGAHEGDNRD